MQYRPGHRISVLRAFRKLSFGQRKALVPASVLVNKILGDRWKRLFLESLLKFKIVAMEDVDWLAGKEASRAEYGHTIQKLLNTDTYTFLTGIDLEGLSPG